MRLLVGVDKGTMQWQVIGWLPHSYPRAHPFNQRFALFWQAKSVTEIVAGDVVRVRWREQGTHVGIAISAVVKE